MKVYRIAGKKYAGDISGKGAALYGGRWNKKGTAVLYTGESIEIALLEILVHTPPMLVPDLSLVTLEIPGNSITELKPEELPPNWFDYPAPGILAEIAQQWIEQNQNLALKVPSSIVHSSYNYILNCQHKDYNNNVKILEIKDFHFDRRLKKC